MWIGHNKGWLSIVAHRNKPEHLLVRARKEEHITEIWDDAEIYVDANADYPYRADILRQDVARELSFSIASIEYSNFKNSVKDRKLAGAYHDVWNVMFDYAWGWYDEK